MINRHHIKLILSAVILVLSGCKTLEKIDEVTAEIIGNIDTGGEPEAKQGSNPSTGNSKQTTFSHYDKALVQDVQVALNRKGYRAGRADGLWGARSRTAMRNYQGAINLKVTGELDRASLDSMGIDSGRLADNVSKLESIPKPVENMPATDAPGEQAKSAPNVPEADQNAPVEPSVPADSDEGDLFAINSPSTASSSTKQEGVVEDEKPTILFTKVESSLYEEPNSYSKSLIRIPEGAPLSVLNESADWLAVEYKTYTGYVEKYAIQ